MYGIAKGPAGEDAAIYGLDFEPIYDTSIMRVTLGPPPVPGGSITKSGVTIQYGSNEDAEFSYSGFSSDRSYFYFSGDDSGTPPTGVKGVTWKKGYYCYHLNKISNSGDWYWDNEIEIEFGVSGAENVFSTDNHDTRCFHLTKDCGPIGFFRFRHRIVDESTYSDLKIKPRLYYLGEDPFSKMSTNCAVFAKCSSPGTSKYMITDSTSYTTSENGMIVRLNKNNGEIGNFVAYEGCDSPAVNFGHNFISAHKIDSVDVKSSSGVITPPSFIVRKNKDVLNYNTGFHNVIYAIKTV